MPAAAVIPAPVAYAIVAVAKRLAVVYPYGCVGVYLFVGLARYIAYFVCGVVQYSFFISPPSVLSRTWSEALSES